MKVQTISSRDNALVKTIKRLAQSGQSYKTEGKLWLEGEHLCDAYLLSTRSYPLQAAVLAQSAASVWLARLETLVVDVYVLPDILMAHISSLPSAGGLGFVLGAPSSPPSIAPAVPTLILDRVQDAGNVGSILRSAAAFGVSQVLALSGTASLWSPKVLRAGMGAHFALQLVEDLSAGDIQLSIPLLATHVHGGADLHQLQATHQLPCPCAWIMGHEGQGVSQALLDKAFQLVRIKQTGQESLNVAAAAAVCLYASMPNFAKP